MICQTVQMKGKAVMVKPKTRVHFWIQTIQKVPLQQHLLLKLLICICELKVFKFFGILPYISVHDRCHGNHANYSNRCNHANYSNRCNHANCDVDPKEKNNVDNGDFNSNLIIQMHQDNESYLVNAN